MDATDAELLAVFARNQSETAFRELVSRHLRMVFATARRMLDDTHEAEEIAQSVFQLLAEKAGNLDQSQPLAGWLYHTARHHALHRFRSEGRRRQREQTAFAMHTSPESSPPETGLLHELEDALDELETEERNALVLRFLEDRQLKEVGSELGVSEEAARKRVARALDRLRGIFGRRGITTSTGAITAALVAQSSIGVPASLGGSIISAVATGTVVTTTAALVTQTAPSTMTTLFNLKTAAAVIATAAVTGTSTYVAKQGEAAELRTETAALTESQNQIVASQQQAFRAIELRRQELERLRKDTAEIQRLGEELTQLRQSVEEEAQIRQQNEHLRTEIAALIHPAHDEPADEVRQIAAAAIDKPLTLVPGKGTDLIQFGQSKEQVREKLGSPAHETARLLSYPNLGLDVWFTRSEPIKVMRITAGHLDPALAGKFKGEFEGGLKIGSTKDQVLAKLGNPSSTSYIQADEQLDYGDKGLKIRLQGARIIMFQMDVVTVNQSAP